MDENNMMTYYLEERILQTRINRESEKRLQNLIQELRELDNRQIRTKFHKPAPPLTTLIKSIIYYHGDIKAHPFERMLPDGSVKLIFNLRTNKNGEQSSPASKKVWIIGPQQKHTTYQLAPIEENLTVQFTTGVFYSMIDIPATEIKNHFIDAEQIFGTSILSLREKFLSCNDTGMIISMIEQYFLKKVGQLNTEHAMVGFIADNISAPLSTLVNKTGYSHKHVIHLFKKHVGISPKQFQRKVLRNLPRNIFKRLVKFINSVNMRLLYTG